MLSDISINVFIASVSALGRCATSWGPDKRGVGVEGVFVAVDSTEGKDGLGRSSLGLTSMVIMMV